MPLSRSQIALLHVARRELQLEEGDYRAILARYGGAESSSSLTLEGLESVMRHLSQLGFKSTWVKRTFGERQGMASPAQVDLILSLWEKYNGADINQIALNAWLCRFHKVDALRFVSYKKAGPVITALKRMADRPRI
jgi:hypothetical protein